MVNLNTIKENPKLNNEPTVFLGKFEIDNMLIPESPFLISREITVFGGLRRTLRNDGRTDKRIEFLVNEFNPNRGSSRQHHLAQHNSIMYKTPETPDEYECVDMLKKKDIKFLFSPPRWKKSEASIPLYGKSLYVFTKQFHAFESHINKEFFTWNKSCYVFIYVTNEDELSIQIFTQDTSTQTAEDHYKLEAKISEYERKFKCITTVETLLKSGDKHFHEYVLEHESKTSIETLKLLLQYAKTKSLKMQIERKINSIQ